MLAYRGAGCADGAGQNGDVGFAVGEVPDRPKRVGSASIANISRRRQQMFGSGFDTVIQARGFRLGAMAHSSSRGGRVPAGGPRASADGVCQASAAQVGPVQRHRQQGRGAGPPCVAVTPASG